MNAEQETMEEIDSNKYFRNEIRQAIKELEYIIFEVVDDDELDTLERQHLVKLFKKRYFVNVIPNNERFKFEFIDMFETLTPEEKENVTVFFYKNLQAKDAEKVLKKIKFLINHL